MGGSGNPTYGRRAVPPRYCRHCATAALPCVREGGARAARGRREGGARAARGRLKGAPAHFVRVAVADDERHDRHVADRQRPVTPRDRSGRSARALRSVEPFGSAQRRRRNPTAPLGGAARLPPASWGRLPRGVARPQSQSQSHFPPPLPLPLIPSGCLRPSLPAGAAVAVAVGAGGPYGSSGHRSRSASRRERASRLRYITPVAVYHPGCVIQLRLRYTTPVAL